MTAPYRDMQPCEPGFCFQATAVGSELTCFGECVAARYLRGRPVADVDLPADGSDIEPALGERWFCGGCGAEYWEHEDDDGEPCCDWSPWEEATWD